MNTTSYTTSYTTSQWSNLKMATTYDRYSHSQVTVEHPRDGTIDRWCLEGWQQPVPILLVVGERVWLSANHCQLGHPEVRQVGDGLSNGYDAEGDCIVSVPAAWCRFWTEEEAHNYRRLWDADGDMLAADHKRKGLKSTDKTDDELKGLARRNIESHADYDEDADPDTIYDELYTLAFDALHDAGVCPRKAGQIAGELAQQYAQP